MRAAWRVAVTRLPRSTARQRAGKGAVPGVGWGWGGGGAGGAVDRWLIRVDPDGSRDGSFTSRNERQAAQSGGNDHQHRRRRSTSSHGHHKSNFCPIFPLRLALLPFTLTSSPRPPPLPLQWQWSRKDPLHDFVQDLADTLGATCEADVSVYLALDRCVLLAIIHAGNYCSAFTPTALLLFSRWCCGDNKRDGAGWCRSPGRSVDPLARRFVEAAPLFDRIVFVEPLVLHGPAQVGPVGGLMWAIGRTAAACRVWCRTAGHIVVLHGRVRMGPWRLRMC